MDGEKWTGKNLVVLINVFLVGMGVPWSYI